MKIAVIGSRGGYVPTLEPYLPQGVTEIVSGGAKGIDACAAAYAREHGIRLTEFSPQYARYGRAAPLKRNLQIIAYADRVLAFWDGESSGTKFVIDACRRENIPLEIVLLSADAV